MSDLVKRLNELIEQATKERSHYYVKKIAEEARDEIERLEKERDELKRKGEELCCLSGNLMVERDELKARLEKYEGAE